MLIPLWEMARYELWPIPERELDEDCGEGFEEIDEQGMEGDDDED